jgi:hypothetical protein
MENPLEGTSQKQRLIIGGVIALGVGLVVYTRYKAGQQIGPAEAMPDQQPQGGGGGGFSVSAPNQQVADQYDTAMKSAEADAANLQNSYLSEQLRQQKSQFDLAQKEHSAQFETDFANQNRQADLQFGVASNYAGLINTQIGQVKNAYNNPKLKMECGKDQSTYIDINGNLACKTSGKSGVKAITNTIGSGIQNIVQGYLAGFAGAAQGAGAYQGGQVFGTPPVNAATVRRQKQSPAEQQTLGKPHPSSFV